MSKVNVEGIKYLLENGFTYREIGFIFGVSHQRIEQIIEANNIDITGCKNKHLRRMYVLYKNGMDINQIAKLTGYSYDQVRRYIKQIEHSYDPPNKIKRKINNLFLNGYNTADIAKELEIPEDTVRIVLKYKVTKDGKSRIKHNVTRDMLLKFIKNGYRRKEIAETIGVSIPTVDKYIKKFRLTGKLKRGRKCKR